MQFVEQTLDSREVAQMVEKDHHKLLRDIRRYIAQLTESKIGFSDFFTESKYKDSTGRELSCYLVTRKGCEFIANKLTGQKGTEFTARYINRFHEMEEQLQKENHMDWFVNDVRVFQHREFGILRTLKLDGQDYFIGIDATRSLGYVNNTDTLKKRVSNQEKCYVRICDVKMCRNMVAVTRAGMDELIQTGQLPLASKYGEWLQKQVYPTLDKNGDIEIEQTKEIVPVEQNIRPVPESTEEKTKPMIEQSKVVRAAQGMVVDIPENKEAQQLISEVRKYITALDALLDVYDMYHKAEDFNKVAYTVMEMGGKISRATLFLYSVKPGIVKKYL